VLAPCSEYAIPYINDVIIFSSTWAEHTNHMREVLARLREAGLTASPKKCTWGGKAVQFLGHSIGEGKISIPEKRVQAIRDYKRPRSKKGLRTFLGMVSFTDAIPGCLQNTQRPCLRRQQSRSPV